MTLTQILESINKLLHEELIEVQAEHLEETLNMIISIKFNYYEYFYLLLIQFQYIETEK